MTNPAETYEKTFTGQEPFIAQHRSAGTGLLPAAVQLEMALVGVARRRRFAPLELTGVTFLRPLFIADRATAPVRLDVTDDGTGLIRFELTTVVSGSRKPLSAGAGRFLPAGTRPPRADAGQRPAGARDITPERLYAGWEGQGLQYGPDFRTVRALSVHDGETARATLRSDAEPMPWYADPLLVDGVFQVVSCALQDLSGADGPYPMLPIGLERLALFTDLSALTDEVTVHVRRTGDDGAYATADALLLGRSEEVLAEFRGVRMRRTTGVAGTTAPARREPLPVSRIAWHPRESESGHREPASGTWVVLHHGPTDRLGTGVAERLRADGARVVEVAAGPAAAPSGTPDPDLPTLDRRDEEAFRRLWDEVGDPVAGLVHLWNADGPSDGGRGEEEELGLGLYSCLAALRTLGERQRKCRFLVVTRDGQPVANGDRPVPARSALWGLVRTAAIEYPGLRPRLVDLGGDPGELLPALVAELGDVHAPVEVGYRDGVRHVPVRVRDRSAHTPPHPAGQGPVRPGGRYLVLGGHGGLGLEVAERFAREGAGLVALVSRSGANPAAEERIAAITAHGCAAVSYSADITVPGALAALVERMRQEHGEVHGVVHAAGTLKDGLIRSATAEDVAAVMRPKADGVRELAAAVAGRDLDFAVLFASVSGTFGNLGQGGYAAANAYLDGYAHAHGAPWLSVDWGLWGEVGMGTAVADRLRARGVRPLTTAEGLDALVAVLGADRPARQLVIAHPDAGTEIAEPDDPADRAGSATPAQAGSATPAGQAEGAADSGGEAGDAAERVADALAGFLAQRLGIASYDREAPLSEYGMSSIMSVELSEELSRRWGIGLPATLFLEYGTFEELVEALIERYGAAAALPKPAGGGATDSSEAAPGGATDTAVPTGPAEPSESTGPAVPEDAPRFDAGPAAVPSTAATTAAPAGRPERSRRPAPDGGYRDVAVVAVSGDLPGAPGGVAELWPLLRAGGHAFTDVPAERWDVQAHFEPRGPRMTGTYCRKGAFLAGTDRFDPAFFGISVREAEEMDVQQKLLLEHAWAVRDDAGLAGRRDIGVFVGATYTHHRDTRGLESVGPHTALGSMNAVLANRISYALDLTGPSQTVDTLCSSSLVALQQAVAALRDSQCGAAIVAACQVGLTPWYYRSLSQLGALSETLPRPFDEHADGFLPGEGALAVLLKPLADAERDGDRIWGVVRGTAVNHGGRGSALPVPRSEAQAAVVRAALDDAGLAPADISLIETHGTATRLGDPIEIAALTEVFGDDPDRDGPCHLGAVKGNIGHLEPAAGLAGLVKALLCLRHGEIPPVAGFEKPSSHLDLSSGPFEIPTEPRPWTSPGPRRFGVSSFGMGGTNAHVVVEEYLAGGRAGQAGSAPAAEAAHEDGAPGEHLLVVSGHTPEALARRTADTRSLLRGETASGLRELCRSSAVGRDHRAYRVAVLGRTAEELGAGLDHALRLADRAPGTVLRGSSLVETASDGLGAAALRYAEGKTVDWASVYPDPAVRRRSLPPYPFRAAAAAAGTAPAAAVPPGPAGSAAGAPAEDVAEAVRGLSRAHRVLGEDTVPGAVPLALGLRAAGDVRDVAFTGRGTGPHPLTSDLDEPGRTGPATFRHAGRVIARLTTGGSQAGPAPAARDVDAVRAELGRSLAPAGLYAWFAAKGMELTAPLRSISEVHYGPRRVLARVDLAPAGSPLEAETAALDAALQAMAVLTLAAPEAPTGTFLPVSVDRAARWGDPAHTAYVLLDGAEQAAEDVRRGDAALLAADGRVLVRLDGIEYRTVTGHTTGTTGEGATAGPALTPTGAGATAGPARAADRGADDFARTPRTPRHAAAEEAVVEVVRAALHDPRITATTSLSAVGIDSMLATAVAAELDEKYGVPLSPTDVLDAADCRTLAAHVAGLAPQEAFAGPAADTAAGDADGGRPARTTGGRAPSGQAGETGTAERPGRAEPADAPATPAARIAADRATDRPALFGADPGEAVSADDVAVIGLAVALPGAADPDRLWDLLAESGDRIGPAPAHRWGRYAGQREPDVGGFLDGVEEFDARFFDFFPKQAEALDPQARWLLRTTWEALESAGLPPRGLSPSTGVFVGASYQHYKDYNLPPELDAPAGLGNHNAFLANRVSFFLDLHGPSMTIDTLCSSSLVALHTAVRSIRAGECEQAVVAGVRAAVSPLHYIAMRNLRALSPSGRSRPFDAGADGFVPGEGVVTVVLKPLRAALRDGDRVRGVIKGSAVNHGGRTSGLTVPSSAAQQAVISAALVDAGVSVESIGLVEAHGTGTSLGDPIEVEGLTRAWRALTGRSQFCAIGSLKGNVGHLEPAAGLAGLVKVLLAMERGVVPPSLHVVRPNDHIRFEETPFYLADRVGVWPRPVGGRRRGAVSAFGMGGVNAHVIMEEAPAAPARDVPAPESFVVRVSGADETAVRTLAAAYAARFDAARDAVETADLCHTANTGRSPLEFQSAVHGRSAADLAAALRSVADGQLPVARVDVDLTAGAAAPNGTTAAPGHPAGAAELARAGYAHIDWAGLSAAGARVTDLPTYPFAGTPFWRGPEAAGRPGHAEPPAGQRQDTVALRVEWRARALPPVTPVGPATVSLAAADPAIGEVLTRLLRERGVTVVAPGAPADGALVVGARDTRPPSPGELEPFWAQLGDLMRTLPPRAGVLWASFGGPDVSGGQGGTDPVRAATAMAVRAAGAEGRRPTAVVHLDPADPAEAQAAHLAAEYATLANGAPDTAATDAGTTLAAYRRGVRYVPETAPARPGPPYSLPAEGYCLVTGGLGAVGLRLTERLIARGARRVAVVGRSALDAARARTLRQLAGPAEVEYLPCDVSDPAALAEVADRLGRRWGRLVGVVHASGWANPFGAMHRRPWSDAEKVLAPKVAGSLHVVRLAKEQRADFAVLVSSIAGTQALAGRGLVDYSLANAFQLALAEREDDVVTAVTAHAWPNWTGIGMKADDAFSAAYSIGAEEALDAFGDHLRSGGAVLFPGRAPVPAQEPPVPAVPALATPAAPAVRAVPADPAVTGDGAPSPAAGPEPAVTRRDTTVMRAHVRSAFLHVLGEDPGDTPLQRLGLDSLMIAELTTALERGGGPTVDPSLLLRARTAEDIAAELAETAGHAGPVQHAGQAEQAEHAGPAEHPGLPASAAAATTAAATASAPGHDGAAVSTLSALLRPLLDDDGRRGAVQA